MWLADMDKNYTIRNSLALSVFAALITVLKWELLDIRSKIYIISKLCYFKIVLKKW